MIDILKGSKLLLCVIAACLETLCFGKLLMQLDLCWFILTRRAWVVWPIYCNPHLLVSKYTTKELLQSTLDLMGNVVPVVLLVLSGFPWVILSQHLHLGCWHL